MLVSDIDRSNFSQAVLQKSSGPQKQNPFKAQVGVRLPDKSQLRKKMVCKKKDARGGECES